jgi:hypothetical protein
MPTVFVHLDAAPGVRLETSHPKIGEWSFACEAPCDKPLPQGPYYRLSGTNILPSHYFLLRDEPSVRIRAAAASQEAYAGSFGLALVGAVASTAGVITLFAGLPLAVLGPPGPGNVGLEAAGGIMILAGGGVVVAGILLLKRSAQSEAIQTDLLPKPSPRPNTAWLRAPVWRDSVRNAAAGPGTVGIPIFSRSF